MRRFIFVLFVAIIFSGCFSMRLSTPPGQHVQALSDDQPASVRKEQKVWYALWGIVPITENSSQEFIRKHNLKNVRMTTQHTVADVLVSFITGIVSIVPATIVIEGNPAGEEGMTFTSMNGDMPEAAPQTRLPNFRARYPKFEKQSDSWILDNFRRKYPQLRDKSDDELIAIIESKYSAKK